ncbi:uncharacterized protein LOC102674091 [Apis dorsata]|uniref:uncharacterized protein LOC102674091 n=1 Tax=Apis dorsata TaxID=7462 RepID=UPI0003DF6D7F|nr:uncharacterized protein LOC102674091 [Apis dorsata]
MAGSIFHRCVVPLCFVVLVVAWADDRVFLTEEDERRWNTPPELIPEQVIKESDAKARSLSVSSAESNAHSFGFQVRPEGVSYSQSNSFGRPLSQTSGVISQSQSVSFAAGLTGIAGALSVSQYYPVYGNQGNVVSFGSGTSSSTSSAASSAGSTHSFSSSPHVATIELVKGMPVRFPGQSQHRPIWTNIRPNINNNGPSRIPKLEIEVKPHQYEQKENRFPIDLSISTQETKLNNNRPTIQIHKWRPSNDDEIFNNR